MSKAIQENWVILNYDFGLKGDYESLYSFLDNLNATECGKACAAFEYDFIGGSDLTHAQKIEQIKKKVEEKVTIHKGDRIYVIVHDKLGTAIGGFIFGHRQRPDWEGYGSKEDKDELPF